MNIQIFPIDQDRYKLPDEFKTGSHCSSFLGATCPKLLKKSLSAHALNCPPKFSRDKSDVL